MMHIAVPNEYGYIAVYKVLEVLPNGQYRVQNPEDENAWDSLEETVIQPTEFYTTNAELRKGMLNNQLNALVGLPHHLVSKAFTDQPIGLVFYLKSYPAKMVKIVNVTGTKYSDFKLYTCVPYLKETGEFADYAGNHSFVTKRDMLTNNLATIISIIETHLPWGA